MQSCLETSLPHCKKINCDQTSPVLKANCNKKFEKISRTKNEKENLVKESENTHYLRTEKTWKTTNSTSKNSSICLRKPKVVSRFNVRKALQESPIYYHIRLEDKKKTGHSLLKNVTQSLEKDEESVEKSNKPNSNLVQRQLFHTAQIAQWPASK